MEKVAWMDASDNAKYSANSTTSSRVIVALTLL
jgi:hypothetical protein